MIKIKSDDYWLKVHLRDIDKDIYLIFINLLHIYIYIDIQFLFNFY